MLMIRFNIGTVTLSVIALITVQRRRLLIDACFGGPPPGACCSPNTPSCNNPCPHSYVAPSSSSYGNSGGSYSNSYSTDSYGGSDSYGSGGYGGGDYNSRPSNLDKHGNYGGYNSYGGSSYGHGGYGGGSGEYMSKSGYGGGNTGYGKTLYPEPSYSSMPLPSYGSSSSYNRPSYGQLPYGQSSYGQAPYAPVAGGIPYSNALQPYTLVAADQSYGTPQQSALNDGYVNVGEPTVYPVPPYPQQPSPFAKSARKAAGKKILSVTTLRSDGTAESSTTDDELRRQVHITTHKLATKKTE